MKTLWNVSFVNRDGNRTLFGPSQGRHMKETREEAEVFLRALIENTGEARLIAICGDQAKGTFRVDAFECHEHGDPVGRYVK